MCVRPSSGVFPTRSDDQVHAGGSALSPRDARTFPEPEARHRSVVHHRLREIPSAKGAPHVGDRAVRVLPQARNMVLDQVVGLEALALQCRVVFASLSILAKNVLDQNSHPRSRRRPVLLIDRSVALQHARQIVGDDAKLVVSRDRGPTSCTRGRGGCRPHAGVPDSGTRWSSLP